MPSSAHASPNVTPMIDVMLVLLIVFMVVTPTLLDGFRAEPPNAFSAREHPRDSSDVTLGIDVHGDYYLNKERIQPQEIGPRLDAIYARRQNDRVLYLRADENLEYDRVLAAVDTVRAHGIVMIGMITRR